MLHYLETDSVDPYYNLAFEEYVLLNRREGDYLLLWQNDNTIVIGRNQNTAEEINAAFAEQHNISVVRRITGGGAVYHDLGNLNYSFITDAEKPEELAVSHFTGPVVAALRRLGLNAVASGRNDILVNGNKVSGTAQRLEGKRILHHGTLLFDSDFSVMEQALRVKPEKFRSKSAKSIRSRVGNISDFLPDTISLADFWYLLKANLTDEGLLQEKLREEELLQVKKIREEKYVTWEWNYGHSPAYQLVNSRCFSGGILEVRLNVEKGIIQNVLFAGDFLSRRDINPLCEALRGCQMEKESVDRVLLSFPLEDYFGCISRQEICDTICNREDLST